MSKGDAVARWRESLRWISGLAIGAATALVCAASATGEPAFFAGAAAVGVVAGVALAGVGRPAAVLVAPDGVRVRWLRLESFLSYREIDRIRLVEVDLGVFRIELHARDGRVLAFRGPEETIREVYARIEQDRIELGHLEEDRHQVLARGERDDAAWLEYLDKQRGQAGYRGAITEELLWSTLESPASPPSARAAAALILRRAVPNRARLGQTARFVAAPKVRVAIESAASDASDEDVAEAVVAVDDRIPRVRVAE